MNIGRYDVLAEIGRGAMGVVYRAFDPLLDRTVAIKTINMALDPDDIEFYERRFMIEARAAGGLNHPNIVTIHDIGRCGELAYMAMEYLDGRELKDLINRGELGFDRALELTAQIADGLAYAHERGVIHRDVKPGNIMVLADGRVKITDFGIARLHGADARTQTGLLLGSPRYLSPEQVLGHTADARVDLFALGVILYEMMTGRSPFSGSDVQSVMYQVIHHTPAAPGVLNPALPALVDLIAARALAKLPDARYQNAADMADDLRTCRRQCAPDTDFKLPARVRSSSGATGAVTESSSASGAATVSRGLAREFDSTEATIRLAARSAAIDDPDRLAATVGVSREAVDAALKAAGPRPVPEKDVLPVASWSTQDRRRLLGAVTLAIGMSALLLYL
ncbi:MAG: serine/threonine-protein kinase [Methyloversatilis sp.]|nr:serine/threonine-protein kinase [Methyloversatilis sp.]MDP3456893.1 serine/threonine-protein kinase [Methyloversatilis sp.]MDP3580097.1 serine/threonine-protein kinase [Methyloversatilis sp.]